MDRKTKQSLLCALEEKLISVRRILEELGTTSPLLALEKLQTFCREETAKLILDEQRAKALPFLNLTAENESTRRALTACQSDLRTKLEHLTSEDDIETLLVPYQKFVALLQSDNPSTKLNSSLELQRYFPDELIFAALQVQKIIHPATTADTPSPAQASAATEPPVSAAPAANKNCHAAEAITETAAEEMPQALRVFFTDAMLLPDNYDYGMLEVSASPKAEKNIGIKVLKSDIRHLSYLGGFAKKTMHELNNLDFVSLASVKANIKSYLSQLPQKISDDEIPSIAEKFLNNLWNLGYLTCFTVSPFGKLYCASQKLYDLFHQKEACQYLKIERISRNQDSKEPSHLPKYADCRLAMAQSIAYSYDPAPDNIERTYPTDCCLTQTMYCAKMTLYYKSGCKNTNLLLGIFCDASPEKDNVETIDSLQKIAAETTSFDHILLGGMERSQLEALLKRLKTDNTYKNLFPSIIYFYLLPEDQLYDEQWEKATYTPCAPEDAAAPLEETAPKDSDTMPPAEETTANEISSSIADIAEKTTTEEPSVKEPPAASTQAPKAAIPKAAEDKQPIEQQASTAAPLPAHDAETAIKAPKTAKPLNETTPMAEEHVPTTPQKSDVTVPLKKAKQGQMTRTDVLKNAIHAAAQDKIPATAAVLGYTSRYQDGWKTDYDQFAYAVHDPAAHIKYASDTVCTLFAEPFAEECAIFGQYLEIATACRTFFYNDTEHDYSSHDLYIIVTSKESLPQPLADFLYRTMDFKEKYHKGIDFYADYRRKDQKSVEKELAVLKHEAEDCIETLIKQRDREKKAQERFIETKKVIFDPNGDIATYLDAVKNNENELLPYLKEYLQETFIEKGAPVTMENISGEKIDKFINDAWNEAAKNISYVKRNTPLMGSLRNNLISKLKKSTGLFCRWLLLAEKSSPQEDETGNIAYKKLRSTLLKDLQAAMAQSLVEQSSDILEVKAGKNVLRSCLKELEDRLTGNYKPELARFFYVDFLRADDLLLDENYLPDFRHWKHIDDDAAYLKELLSSATGDSPTFQQRLEKTFKEAGDNYQTAKLIDDYLQASGEGSYLEQKGYQITDNEKEAERACEKDNNEFIENLELAQSYGQLDTANENQKEDIRKIVSECYAYAKTSKNFGIFRTVSQYYIEKIRENALKRGDSLREELATCHRQLKETGDETAHQEEYLRRIKQAIDKQNYTVAEDLLSRWRSHDIEDHFAIEGKDHLQEFLRDYDVYYHKVNKSGITLDRQLRSTDHNKKERGATRLAENWIRGGRTASPDEKMKDLLTLLGWNVAKVKRETPVIKNTTTFEITLQHPGNGRKSNYKHPIAAFGSLAEQEGLRAVCLFGEFNANNLIDICKELGNAKHTLIFLDYALQLTERRRLARKIKEELSGRKVFLLIDRIVIYYLMCHYDPTQISRILMLITMPFAAYQPYIWESSSVMPAEMFMGRRKELADIESSTGVNIVYGGRQLGKSALLKMAEKDIDHDENHDRAIVVDIKDRDHSAAAKLISNVLSERRFFTQEVETNDWDELAHAIRLRLQDETAEKIPYFLLMLDEADTFIESCEAVNFKPFSALKSIQGIGTGRFKFVIAGLRNIVRFNRDMALGNNNVLPHMKSMTVKPFNISEARELLETPLYYLGFRFPEGHDMVPLILASTNYFPGLIQLYCAKLIEAMSNNYAGYDEIETPAYEVREEHIKKVLADPGFEKEVKEKFEITLRLGDDNYYFILALLMAYLYHTNGSPNGYTALDIYQQIKENHLTDLSRFSVEQIEALMEELRELNVFRRKGDERYLFNRHTFFQMMGDENEVIDNLVKIMNGENP